MTHAQTADAVFTRLIDPLIAREGEYSNHPADRGGETRYGITKAVARQHGYDGALRAFPRDQAVAIYKRIYWLKPRLDDIAAIAPDLAAELFDTGVNMGIGTAARFLQRALNALNRQERDYADIVIAGATGPATLGALQGYMKRRTSKGERILIRAVEALQGERYIAIAESRPSNEAFVYGWLAERIGQDGRH